jgi:methionine-S-sulfoxide reductase
MHLVRMKTIDTVYFAGGCFWCMSPIFDAIDGVVSTRVGYMGGSKVTANYADVSTGQTAHFEAIEVTYRRETVTYSTLVTAFLRAIDPTDPMGQFADQGPHYKTAIFVASSDQRTQAHAAINKLNDLGIFTTKIVTKVLPETPFYPAEAVHQEYYKTQPDHYRAYAQASGRNRFLHHVWGRSIDH